MKNNAATWMPALRDGITYHNPENAPHPGPGYRYLTSLELEAPPADTDIFLSGGRWDDLRSVVPFFSYRTKAPLPKDALPEKPVVGRCYDIQAVETVFIGRCRADGGWDVLVSHFSEYLVGSVDYTMLAATDWEVPEPDVAPVPVAQTTPVPPVPPPTPRPLVAGDWVSVREKGGRILGVTQLVRPLTDGSYCYIAGYAPWIIDPPVYAPIEHTFFSTWGVRPEDRVLENPPEIIKQPDPAAELEAQVKQRDAILQSFQNLLQNERLVGIRNPDKPIWKTNPDGSTDITNVNVFSSSVAVPYSRLEHLEEVASLASNLVAARAEQAEIGSEVMRAFKALKGVISK